MLHKLIQLTLFWKNKYVHLGLKIIGKIIGIFYNPIVLK